RTVVFRVVATKIHSPSEQLKVVRFLLLQNDELNNVTRFQCHIVQKIDPIVRHDIIDTFTEKSLTVVHDQLVQTALEIIDRTNVGCVVGIHNNDRCTSIDVTGTGIDHSNDSIQLLIELLAHIRNGIGQFVLKSSNAVT